jgi:hypothetical protein
MLAGSTRLKREGEDQVNQEKRGTTKRNKKSRKNKRKKRDRNKD